MTGLVGQLERNMFESSLVNETLQLSEFCNISLRLCCASIVLVVEMLNHSFPRTPQAMSIWDMVKPKQELFRSSFDILEASGCLDAQTPGALRFLLFL